MLQKTNILNGILLGVMVGLSLFCAESLFIILSGTRIPLSYLSFTFFIDLLGGVALGFLAILLFLLLIPLMRGEKSKHPFDLMASLQIFLLTFSLGFFFLHGRILAGSKFYEWKGIFYSTTWAVLCLILSSCFYLLFPFIRGRFFERYPSYLAEILFLEILALGYLWINEYKLVGSQKATSLLVNIFFIVALGIGYLLMSLLFSKWASRKNKTLARSSLTFFLVVIVVGSIGLMILWSSSYLSSEPSAEPEYQVKEIKHPDDPRFNIILISVDTLRAANLSCYGYPLETSPNIDRFAKEALIFSKAVSCSSWTLPAHASLFTGLIPYRHGAHYSERQASESESKPLHELDMAGVQPLSSKHMTLAETLRGEGYVNVAFVSNFAALSESLGVAQGFDIWEDRERTWVSFYPFYHRILKTILKDYGFCQDFINRMIKPFRSAEEISDEAIRWLREDRKEPFFLFLNYMEPHTPYLPYPPFHNRFMKRRIFSMKDPFWEVMSAQRPLKKEEKDYLLAQYNGEIAYADFHIGRLFDFLKSSDLYDRSMIILLSDHGELFGEHNLLRHTSLYEEVLKIPLIVKYPLSERAGIDGEEISIIDVMPEILTRIGKTLPGAMDGSSFAERDAHPLAELYVNPYYYKEFGERFGNILRAKYWNPYKLIVGSSQHHELYHLEKDPQETKNLVNLLPEVQNHIQEQIEEILKEKPLWEDQTDALDEEAREKLKSLGYLD